jgi:hypothetical protein
MNKLKIIGKMAKYIAIISTAFTILLAVSMYLQIQIQIQTSGSSQPPIDYLVLYILSSVLPYLFLAVLSLVVSVVIRNLEKEAAPQAQPTAPVS